ncbi:MAG: hypothetical protein KDE48_00655 [Anaerolineales bacterium]|nr:hypothetical protein [Anaerolineales bacterium]
MSSSEEKNKFCQAHVDWRPIFLSLLFLLVIGLFSGSAAAQSLPTTENQATNGLWYDVDDARIDLDGARLIIPQEYRSVGLDVGKLQTLLAQAPFEGSAAAQNDQIVLSLPLPDGDYGRFQIVESPIMEPELAAKFPEIKTYAGQGLDDASASVRLDWTPQGFHAMILSSQGDIYIDPYARGNTSAYISYFKQDFLSDRTAVQYPPLDPGGLRAQETADLIAAGVVGPSGAQLRTYRLAVAATGEYTTYHGGTVNLGQAAVVTAINRVTGIYEVEIAVRLQLVANNNLVIYTNPATDPYTNGSPSALLSQNQANLDAVIGSANYDVGHVFSTGGGGLAALSVICSNSSKARGETGLSNPIGDPFYVDYVAHELGHQFGGNHTFNGNAGNCAGGNRNGSTAYEPGSGSTIQAYAGICSGQNIQSNSDAYFHTLSFDEMVAHTTAGGGSTCAAVTNTDNHPPVPNANASGANGVTIPINTPFTLTGAATDLDDGDLLTYNWEEFDLGPAGHPDNPVNNAPIFRSFTAQTSPARTFPQISDIVNNTHTLGELLPSYGRSLTFRLTVRDNRALGGGVDHDQIAFSATASAGPFLVTAPNTAVTWTGGASETVTWDVANTTAAPVSCGTVDVTLSTDGGYTYPLTLATGVNNDGSQTVTVPNVPTTSARVKVACATNIFFDISNSNFTIEADTCSVPDQVTDLGASANVNGTDIDLAWTATGADLYAILRGVNDPYLSSRGILVTTTAATSYSDTDRIGDPANNYFYIVIANNICGAASARSNYAGEFDFSIEPGTS